MSGPTLGDRSSTFLGFVECAGCGETFAVRSKHALSRAKWCSERCRKAQYQQPCERCGAPCGGSDKSRFCTPCGAGYVAEVKREQARPYRELVERLWAEGHTCRQIGAALGWNGSPSVNIARLRQRGYDLPHRRSAEDVAKITEGNRRMTARRQVAA